MASACDSKVLLHFMNVNKERKPFRMVRISTLQLASPDDSLAPLMARVVVVFVTFKPFQLAARVRREIGEEALIARSAYYPGNAFSFFFNHDVAN